MKLYVGNFSSDMTEDRLRDIFTPFGTPDSVRVISDRQTGQARGFGFVEFSDNAAANAAMASLDKKEIDGRPLTVNEARPINAGSSGRF
jgi:cold-inducible RNA-binding protein